MNAGTVLVIIGGILALVGGVVVPGRPGVHSQTYWLLPIAVFLIALGVLLAAHPLATPG